MRFLILLAWLVAWGLAWLAVLTLIAGATILALLYCALAGPMAWVAMRLGLLRRSEAAEGVGEAEAGGRRGGAHIESVVRIGGRVISFPLRNLP